MNHKQPSLPQTKFANRNKRKKKKPLTPEIEAKLAREAERHFAKLEMDERKPVNPNHKGLALAFVVAGCDPSFAGLIAALSGVDDLKPDEEKETAK